MKGYRPAGASNIPAYPCIRKEYQFPADLAEVLSCLDALPEEVGVAHLGDSSVGDARLNHTEIGTRG